MKPPLRAAVVLCVVLALVSFACAAWSRPHVDGKQMTISRSSVASSTEIIIATFAGNKRSDGQTPRSAVSVNPAGGFFGTTRYGGGTFTCKPQSAGCGTIYALEPNESGFSRRTIYAFQDEAGGAQPIGGLLVDATRLYGTTSEGGDNKAGTVFELHPSGSTYSKQTLYAFRGDRKGDGAIPEGTLIRDASGALYGTTSAGGAGFNCVCGTTFKLARTGQTYIETVLHSFVGGGDGSTPFAGLVADKRGDLYGTTLHGGGGGPSYCAVGCGTVFKLTPNGSNYSETVIYAFQGSADGAYPYAPLIIDKSGALYGTTADGGFLCQGGSGCGLVFKLTPVGSSYTETVLYRFQGAADGARPLGGLMAGKGGVLYGTTSNQGDGQCSCGTAFALAPGRRGYTETVLHRFAGTTSDGSQPESELVFDASGALFGTTLGGGTGNNGTVFSLLP